jgi:hypothetical protein
VWPDQAALAQHREAGEVLPRLVGAVLPAGLAAQRSERGCPWMRLEVGKALLYRAAARLQGLQVVPDQSCCVAAQRPGAPADEAAARAGATAH